ncbi:MAG: AAA family ATPase [Proteobacteria bacterium]|nr:AAA family ATPase [Pseudomonadota bacterium]
MRARRLAKVAQNVGDKLTIVDNAAVDKMRELVETYNTAKAAAELAAQEFRNGVDLLPGTGGEAWKELFEAARKFALQAYPGQQFPDFGPDAKCPLCQQPLAEGAILFQNFEKFIRQEAETISRAKKKSLDERYKEFVSQSVSLGIDDELLVEVEGLDATLATDVRAYDEALAARYAAIKIAVESLEWGKVNALPASPASRLQSLVDKLNREAATLEALVDKEGRAALQSVFDDLSARIKLNKMMKGVLAAIEVLDRQAKLTKCLSAVKTNSISIKASDLTQQVLSEDLEAALNAEFKSLGVGELRVRLTSRAERGKAYYKLKLDLPEVKAPADILSEGEQRAIALGSFLAEVKVSGNTGGIVFDDPVSSLDHKCRERLAKRLVKEAAERQVIVFTHDLYFLNLLIYEAEKDRVPIEKQWVTRRPEGFGAPNPDLPFEGMNTQARVKYLRNRQVEIKRLFRSGDELGHRKETVAAYRELRDAWERAVEEVLFRKVVLRFRKGVETKRLSEVVVEDSDFEIIDRGMSRCSNYGHDRAELGGMELPDPDELLSDINALDEWRKGIERRAEAVRESRKPKPQAPAPS